MTLKQREQLDNFKSVLSMMYDTVSVNELVPDKSDKAIIRVQYRNVNAVKTANTFFLYDLASGNNTELHIKDMQILPISKNYVVIEESLNLDNCFIKVLD